MKFFLTMINISILNKKLPKNYYKIFKCSLQRYHYIIKAKLKRLIVFKIDD